MRRVRATLRLLEYASPTVGQKLAYDKTGIIVKRHSDSDSSFEKIRTLAGKDWGAIRDAAVNAAKMRNQIGESLPQNRSPLNEDCSLVVFGSLARDEWTTGSDVDWTLLSDGQADPEHLRGAQKISELRTVKKPGATGVFGDLCFSHDLVHQIGGLQDTNENTTRRVLLLLESTTVGGHTEAYERVLRAVLNRYVEDDPSTGGSDANTRKLPRFLLNDVVRFWRTIAVDFASKQRERAGRGWGLRNAKLRFSRKLTFASGLLMCFECALADPPESSRADSPSSTIAKLLIRSAGSTAIERIAQASVTHGRVDAAVMLFDAYDMFLAIINDERNRAALEKLRSDDSHNDNEFQTIRALGHDFQKALDALFFDTPKIAELTKKYGVF